MAHKKTQAYNVRLRVIGYMDITVDAADEEEAGKNAKNEATLDCMTEWSIDRVVDVEVDG